MALAISVRRFAIVAALSGQLLQVRPGRRRGLLERWKVGLVSDPNQGRVVSVLLGFEQPALERFQCRLGAVQLANGAVQCAGTLIKGSAVFEGQGLCLLQLAQAWSRATTNTSSLVCVFFNCIPACPTIRCCCG